MNIVTTRLKQELNEANETLKFYLKHAPTATGWYYDHCKWAITDILNNRIPQLQAAIKEAESESEAKSDPA